MTGAVDILIRGMMIEGYKQVYEFWIDIRGLGIRSIDDSWEGVERFLKRNPTTSVVAVQNGLITGNILCGCDGRAGCFYHVCTAPGHRKHRIGYHMVRTAMEAPQREGVSKINLIAFKNNEVEDALWRGVGWTEREDISSYELILNEESIMRSVRWRGCDCGY